VACQQSPFFLWHAVFVHVYVHVNVFPAHAHVHVDVHLFAPPASKLEKNREISVLLKINL
jgi:hypothetical protein